jgi:hypothetical protein
MVYDKNEEEVLTNIQNLLAKKLAHEDDMVGFGPQI